MVKHVGVLMVAAGIVFLAAGILIDINYGTKTATGFAAAEIKPVKLGVFDYAEALSFSIAVASSIMGLLFLSRAYS